MFTKLPASVLVSAALSISFASLAHAQTPATDSFVTDKTNCQALLGGERWDGESVSARYSKALFQAVAEISSKTGGTHLQAVHVLKMKCADSGVDHAAK